MEKEEKATQRKKDEAVEFQEMKDQYLTVDNTIQASTEFKAPIYSMYIYPVRGIRAAGQVDSLEVTKHGIKYDRELVLVDANDLSIVTTNKYHLMGCLRQEFKDKRVTITTKYPKRLTDKNLETSLTIDLEDPENFGDKNNLIQAKKGYEGYCMQAEICDWFSAAICKEVFVLRAAHDRRVKLNPKRLIFSRKTDLRKTFTSDAALHIINKASVDYLR